MREPEKDLEADQPEPAALAGSSTSPAATAVTHGISVHEYAQHGINDLIPEYQELRFAKKELEES